MINRRDFIKTAALGTSAFVMTPGFGAPRHSAIPKRFIFMRKCNGVLPHALALPSFSAKEKQMDKSKQAFEVTLDKHELPACLNVLDKYKEHMTVLQGFSSTMCNNGHYSMASVLGCFKLTGQVSGLKRTTVDMELAKLFPSPFGHIELSMSGNKPGIKTGFILVDLQWGTT